MGLSTLGLGGILSFSTGNALASMGAAQRAFGILNLKAEDLAHGTQMAGGAFKSLGLVTAGLSAGVGLAVKVAGDFEQELKNINAVAPYVSGQALEQMKVQALDFGRTTKFTAVEVAQSFQTLSRTFRDTRDTFATIQPVITLAQATGNDMAETTKVMTNMLERFNLGGEDAAHVTDVLAKALSLSQESLQGLDTAMVYVTPAVKTLGLSIEDTVAQLVTLRDAGIEGSVAGSSLYQAYMALANPTAKTNALLDAMHISLKRANGDLKSTPELVNDLILGMSQFQGNADQAAAAADIFGFRGIKAFEGLAGAAKGKLHKDLVSVTAALHDVAGAGKRASEIRMSSFNNSVTMLKNAFESFYDEVITPMLPTFKGVIDGVRGLIDKLVQSWRSLSPETQAFFSKLGAYVAMALPVVAALAGALGVVLSVVGSIGATLASEAGMGAILAVAAALPVVGEVVGAIALAVGVAALAWSLFSDEISDFVSGVGSGMEGLGEEISAIWNETVDNVRAVWNEVMSLFQDNTTMMKIDWKSVGETVGHVIGAMVWLTMKAVEGLILLGAVVVSVAAFFARLLPAKEMLNDIVTTISQIGLAFDEMTNGHFLVGLARISLAITDMALLPLRGLIQLIVRIAEAVGYASPMLTGLKNVATGGLASLIPPQVTSPGDLASTVGNYTVEALKKKKEEINVNTTVNLDGKQVAASSAKYSREISERAGFKTPPYQRALATIHGAMPVPQGQR